jgi:pimeloyl-ACP methyl ester carboxylesterase
VRDPYAGQYQSAEVRVNGLRLYYTLWGEPRNPPLLLVHGLNVQSHTWDPIAARLQKSFRVVAVDLRGHGRSEWAQDGYRVQQFVSDLHGFMWSLGLGPVAFVGHSLGGRVGLAFAGEHPDLVTHLLLSDTGPEVPRVAAEYASQLVGDTGHLHGFRDEAHALEHYRSIHAEWDPIFLDLHVLHQLRTNWAGRLVFRADPDLYWITRTAGLREVPYLWERASAITAPTLIMRGTRSPFIPDALATRMVAAIPKARVENFETGHYIPREVPDQFAEVVRLFVGLEARSEDGVL